MWKLPGMEMHLMWQTYGTSHWCRHSLLLPDSLPDSKIQTLMEGDTPNSHCCCDPGGSLYIPRKHLSVYFDGKREGEVSLFQRTQIPWAPDSHSIGLLLIPTAPPPTGYCKLGLQRTQPGHFMNAEKMSKYSQKREGACDLRAWLTSSTRAPCCSEVSWGNPWLLPFQGEAQNECIQGLQPTTSAKNTIFSEMPNMLVIKAFVWYFQNQNTQWAVAKWFSRVFCFRMAE